MASPASGPAIGAHRVGRGVAVRTPEADVRIRRTLEPGDIGAIAAQHGRLYALEFGLDLSFEAELAGALYALAGRGWPSEREGAWIVEAGAEHAGSLVLTDEGGGAGRVRAFLLEPRLRGRGLGRRLFGELSDRAHEAGYARLELYTFSELRAAARIYTDHGFALVSAETGPRWGIERMSYQRYEAEL